VSILPRFKTCQAAVTVPLQLSRPDDADSINIIPKAT